VESEDAAEIVEPRRTRLLRVAEHLRTQNWTAIAIDFLIVVLGVFVGIQVSNWNSSRLDAAKANAYVARIVDNLRSDIASIEDREAFWGQVIAHCDNAIRYAETGELVEGSAWKTVLAFYQASQVWPWTSNDTTYRELLNGGDLRLIEDERLRATLPVYHGSKGELEYLLAMVPEYRRIVRGLSPAAVADHIWAECHRITNDFQQTLLDCPSPISEAEAQKVLEGYLGHPDLLPQLRFWVANQRVATSTLGVRKVQALRMIEDMGDAPTSAQQR